MSQESPEASGKVRKIKERVHHSVTGFALRRPGIVEAIIRERGTPSLDLLYKSASGWFDSPGGVVTALLGDEVSDCETFVSDAAAIVSGLHQRAKSEPMPYPATHATEDCTLLTLYALVRTIRPAIVVETGVANGFSSEVILHALAANGHGELHSIDISDLSLIHI